MTSQILRFYSTMTRTEQPRAGHEIRGRCWKRYALFQSLRLTSHKISFAVGPACVQCHLHKNYGSNALQHLAQLVFPQNL